VAIPCFRALRIAGEGPQRYSGTPVQLAVLSLPRTRVSAPFEATGDQLECFNSFGAASREDRSGTGDSTFSRLRAIELPSSPLRPIARWRFA
jgi:hypothetical protein